MTTIQIRIDEKTKQGARKAFDKMGLDITSGIKLYLARVAQDKAIPFSVRVPNAESRRALKAMTTGKGLKKLKTIGDFEKLVRAL